MHNIIVKQLCEDISLMTSSFRVHFNRIRHVVIVPL